jgi:MFS family permease
MSNGRLIGRLWAQVRSRVINLSNGVGLLFLALVLPSFLGPVVGIVTDKYGTKWPATAGFLLATPVEVLLRFVKENTLGQKVLMVALLALLGISLDLMSTPLMSEITLIVELKHQSGRYGRKPAYAQVSSCVVVCSS